MATLAKAAQGVPVTWAALALALMVALPLLSMPSAAEVRPVEARDHQATLLAETLSALQPSGVRPQLYFVGFAGYGPEAVFKREVMAVRKLFDERFGTKQRSVALINHASTAQKFPVASADNLEQVLRHLGTIMDPEQDTLFLFLTSHGEQRVLAVDMPGLQLEHLSPERLRGMLDRSGIRKRIVVVSACYSGSFMPDLADPRTLVITAAREDRPSFGCSDKRRWTYFGDAFFNRALRRETSFRKAFHRAKAIVARWETRWRLPPSLPQMSGGEALGLE